MSEHEVAGTAEGGMWAKDKAFAKDGPLKEKFPAGSTFILRSAAVKVEDFETSLGTAPMVHLEVSDILEPDTNLTVSMIGENFANKIRNPETLESLIREGDLPAIVETAEVPTDQPQDAFVIRFCNPLTDDTLKEAQKDEKARRKEQEKNEKTLEDSGL